MDLPAALKAGSDSSAPRPAEPETISLLQLAGPGCELLKTLGGRSNKAATGPLLVFPDVYDQVSRSAVNTIAIRQLEGAMVTKTESTPKPQLHPCLEIATDAAAVTAGLATRYGVKRISTTKCAGRVGIALSIATSACTKDLASDGELGNTTQMLRGSAMFGLGSCVLKGMQMNPSRQTLSSETAAAIGERLGVENLTTGTTASIAEKVLHAGAGGPSWYRGLQYVNPFSYSGYGLSTGGLRYVGFGGEKTAALVADGSMSFAQYNARRAIGTLGNNFGTAYALGGGREAIYLMTGHPKADGTPHTVESAIARANTIGAAAGITGALKDMLQSVALRLR